MEWATVPAYLRPKEKREDIGIQMRYTWREPLREIWRCYVEMGIDLSDAVEMAGWQMKTLTGEEQE